MFFAIFSSVTQVPTPSLFLGILDGLFCRVLRRIMGKYAQSPFLNLVQHFFCMHVHVQMHQKYLKIREE